MNIKALQERSFEIEKKIREKHPAQDPIFVTMMKIIEETGELANAIMISKKIARPEKLLESEKVKEEIGKEITDIFIGLSIIACYYNVDLENATENKLSDHERRWFCKS
jgi:NTP pyrophosphatase (non-canonical NTP hydrolase)